MTSLAKVSASGYLKDDVAKANDENTNTQKEKNDLAGNTFNGAVLMAVMTVALSSYL